MGLEAIMWFVLPAIICLVVITKTIRLSRKIKKWYSWLLSLIIFLSDGLSLAILGTIYFTDSWPTFIPHIAIGFSLILLCIQFAIRQRRDVQSS